MSSHAHLYQTDLISADLFEAKPEAAHWRHCFLGETALLNVELSTVAELESASISARASWTSARWSGPALCPLQFLRGCGLPERLIERLPALVDRSIRFHSCFISYSNHDLAFVTKLHNEPPDGAAP